MTIDNIRWRKSSFSGGGGNECVEVAAVLDATVPDAIRDSKNSAGPVLHGDVQAFLGAIKRGRLTR